MHLDVLTPDNKVNVIRKSLQIMSLSQMSHLWRRIAPSMEMSLASA